MEVLCKFDVLSFADILCSVRQSPSARPVLELLGLKTATGEPALRRGIRFLPQSRSFWPRKSLSLTDSMIDPNVYIVNAKAIGVT